MNKFLHQKQQFLQGIFKFMLMLSLIQMEKETQLI
jgi:hypothetical protein